MPKTLIVVKTKKTISDTPMGLDIHIHSNKNHEIFGSVHHPDHHDYYKYKLSRVFCQLLMGSEATSFEPESEIKQIASITGIDLSPIDHMRGYSSQESLDFMLYRADSEEKEEKIMKEVSSYKKSIEGNIEQVLDTITNLISVLTHKDSLPDTFESEYGSYFDDFQTNPGDGYIGNNFGQDLRNFKWVIEFYKNKGASTVWLEIA